jgi:hypothetical protein
MTTTPPNPSSEPAVPLAYASALPPLFPASGPGEVIAYASGETSSLAPKGTRIALGIFATLYVLVAIPAVVGTIASLVGNVSGSSEPLGILLLHVPAVVVAALYLALGLWFIRRRRWMWRALHVTLGFLCTFELIVAGFGAAMTIAYKHGTGWDGLSFAIGIALFIAASVPFLLHALTKLALLRLNFRRAFGIGDFEPHAVHRAGTILLLSLYALVIVVGGTWFVLA